MFGNNAFYRTIETCDTDIIYKRKDQTLNVLICNLSKIITKYNI